MTQSITGENVVADWRSRAFALEANVQSVILGQDDVIRLILIAVFARGHILLEGDVGVGKTTLLRAMAESIGGEFERIEGTIDLMPHDLVYYTYISAEGKPSVSPGPILKKGEDLSIFFFNEINRARPQVHSLLLRVMAEKSLSAFNTDYHFPYLQVFADRNQLEKDETYELPAALRDRFMMELHVAQPSDKEVMTELMFNPRYYDSDTLISELEQGVVPYQDINQVASQIQATVRSSKAVENYSIELCDALRHPDKYGIKLDQVDDTGSLVRGGMGPRGLAYLVRAARVNAWLNERDSILPEDFHDLLPVIAKHRLFLNPVYTYRADSIINELITRVIGTISAP